MDETVLDMVHENRDAVPYSNVLEWLNGRVAGLQFAYRNGEGGNGAVAIYARQE